MIGNLFGSMAGAREIGNRQPFPMVSARNMKLFARMPEQAQLTRY